MDRPSVIGPPPAHRRLHIGRDVFINADCIFDLGADITIGDRVYLAHRVMLITSTHEISGEHQRAGEMVTSPITIGAGSWLGAGSMVLPGVTVGRGSVVAAGAVVTRDVAPCSLVAGTPARLLRRLPAAGTPPAPPVQLATARSPVAGSDHDGTCGS
jgi:acetyltransferase-like isoleucine patch superfamily enzyme